MAITTGRRTSFQDRASVKDNIDDRLDFLTPQELPFLSYIGFMSDAGGATAGSNSLQFPCVQTRHTWLNDDLVPSVSSVQTAYTAAGGSLVVAAGEGLRFDVDDIIMTGTMYALVTAVSTDTLTITELNSTGANAAVADVIYLIGNARIEGAAASIITARSTDLGSTENFTQIFMAKVDLSGSEMATERWGVSGNPYEYQLNKRLKELAIQLERAAIYGIRNSTYPSTNATRRMMGGLANFIRDDATANVRDAGGADLDEVALNQILRDVWEDGGMPDVVMVGARQKEMVNAFLAPSVRVGRTEGVAGVLVGQYESDYGTVDCLLNRWMKPDDLIVLTREYIGIGPLTGNGASRAFFTEALPKDGDYERTQLIGEYTMEVRNANKAHGWIKNLSKN